MNASSKTALKASNISVLHGEFKAVNQVSLELHSGEWVALVGPNGAGKSSLLKALAGLIPADGQVELMGKPWGLWQRRERAKTLAWLGQAEAGQDDLTVYDVAMLGRLPHQADWLEWVRCLTEQGAAVVSVLHELNLALQADRVWVMSAGSLVHDGLPNSSDTHQALSAVFQNRLQWREWQDGDQTRWVALPK